MWTSVKDKLPSPGKYLTIIDSPIIKYYKILYFVDDLHEAEEYTFEEHEPGWIYFDSEYGAIKVDEVSHWMPLPEMPEGDDNNDSK